MRDGAYSNDEATALIKQLRLTPIVDVIYVVGDLKDASTWNVNSGLYPLTRQADGTYQGTFTGLDRHGDGGYGNRDMVFFSYQGKLLCRLPPDFCLSVSRLLLCGRFACTLLQLLFEPFVEGSSLASLKA